MHSAAPAPLNVPTGHPTPADDVDPGGHTYPAEQAPVQDGDVRPLVDPKRPPGHKLQFTLLPPVLYWPATHFACKKEGKVVVVGEPKATLTVHPYTEQRKK